MFKTIYKYLQSQELIKPSVSVKFNKWLLFYSDMSFVRLGSTLLFYKKALVSSKLNYKNPLVTVTFTNLFLVLFQLIISVILQLLIPVLVFLYFLVSLNKFSNWFLLSTWIYYLDALSYLILFTLIIRAVYCTLKNSI